MKYVNVLLCVPVVVGVLGVAGCCRPVCQPCPSPRDVVGVHRVAPATNPRVMPGKPTESASPEEAPSTESEGLFLRYFDVKDLGVGSGDVLMHDVRTQILPEVWEREPNAVMEIHNHILVMRAPVALLNATEAWLKDMRSGIEQTRQDLAARRSRPPTRPVGGATREEHQTSLVVEIHNVADLTANEAANDVDLHLAGPTGKPTRVRHGAAVSIDALLRGIERAGKSGSWPGTEEATVRASGEHAVVAKGSSAFLGALTEHLAELRKEFGAGLADVPEPKEPVRAVPPTENAQSVQILKTKRVKGLHWEQASLDQVTTYLRTITGLRFEVSDRARNAVGDDLEVTLRLKDASVATVLDLVTSPHGLVWEVREGVVWIDLPKEVDDAPPK